MVHDGTRAVTDAREELLDAATAWSGRDRAHAPLALRPRIDAAAAALLRTGVSTPQLVALEELPVDAAPHRFEAALDEALHELGLSRRRPREEVSRVLLRSVARDVRDGVIGPQTAAAWAVAAGGPADPVLAPLAALFEELGRASRRLARRGEAVADVERRVRAELERAED